MKKPQNHKTYDEMFTKGGKDDPYQLPYWLSRYYPMYLAVLDTIKRIGCSRLYALSSGN